MISFRFHLVSLTAVFLALALGIALGATVVDRSIVEALDRQVTNVKRDAQAADAAAADARGRVGELEGFTDQATTLLVAGRLTGIPVLIVGVRGISEGPVSELRKAVEASGATFEGTVWLKAKLRLDSPTDVKTLAGIIDTSQDNADLVRSLAVQRLADAWSRRSSRNPLVDLQAEGFVDFDAAPGSAAPSLASVPLAATRFVVVSDPDADVPNEVLAHPLAAALADDLSRSGDGVIRLVVAEPTRIELGKPVRATFLGPLRRNGDVNQLLSTVDDLDEPRGRAAAVLALVAGNQGRVGHFGLGPGADRQLPDVASLTPLTTKPGQTTTTGRAGAPTTTADPLETTSTPTTAPTSASTAAPTPASTTTTTR